MINFLKRQNQNGRIYLDYASITPIDDEVSKEYQKVLKEFWANPSSLYKEGVLAHKKLEEARGTVATILEVLKDEVFFTSGGTESNNLAIKGIINNFLKNFSKKPHVISSSIEHPSVRELLMNLSESGLCDVTFLPVLESGLVDIKVLKESLREDTALVTIMYVNNEIGTIQPMKEIAKIVRAFRKSLGRESVGTYPYIHTDACQAVEYCSLRIPALGVDLMTLDGSKIYGPRSVGVLYKKRDLNIDGEMKGGSQENDFRAGTENVAGAFAFATALKKSQENREKESSRIGKLRDQMLMKILEKIPEAKINGDMLERVPNNINICIPGIDAEYTVFRLDAKGVCISSVTSCRNKSEDSSSYVVEALRGGDKSGDKKVTDGIEENCSKSSLRITLGRRTNSSEVERATKIIIETLSDKKFF